MAAKIYESILKIQIIAYFTKYDILHIAQQGFLIGHSVTTYLIFAHHDWTVAYDRRENTLR